MQIKLSDDEATRISRNLAQLNAVNSQTRNLMAQGDNIRDIINTAWRDAHRGKQLEDKEFAERLGDNTVPPMINATGGQVVQFNGKTRTATWETHHDRKRVAKDEVAEPDESEAEASVDENVEESVKEEKRDE